MEAWRDSEARHGRETDLGGNLIVGLSFRLAATREKAVEEARATFEENMKMFGPLGFVRGLTDEQIEALGDPERAPSAGLPTLEEAVDAGSWLCGPPDLIIEKLSMLQERYPSLEEVNMGLPVGTPEAAMLEQYEWFAEEVMPAFRGKGGASAGDDD